jgi:hypothetical protein
MPIFGRLVRELPFMESKGQLKTQLKLALTQMASSTPLNSTSLWSIVNLILPQARSLRKKPPKDH